MFRSPWWPSQLLSTVSPSLCVCFNVFLCSMLWGSGQKTGAGFWKGCRKDRCVSGAFVCSFMRRFTTQSGCCFCFFFCWDPLKKTDTDCHMRTARQQVGRSPCLFVRLCYHLLFPVKTGKDRGENGGVGKCRLDVCWLTTTPQPARKNRLALGVTHSGILCGVIFITFTKRRRDAFPSCWHRSGSF